MKRKVLGIVAAFLVSALSTCQAQQLQHVQSAGRDVAVRKPGGTPPPNGFPIIVFSHGFAGCNAQTKFLMEALAGAGYLVLAPNHQDAVAADTFSAVERRSPSSPSATPRNGTASLTAIAARTWRWCGTLR